VKQLIETKQTYFQIYFESLKSLRQPILDSLKHGLSVFVTLLILLALMNWLVGVVQTIPTNIFDFLDLATALVGSALMFAAKFLKELSSRR
jgi:hypothetical protein